LRERLFFYWPQLELERLFITLAGSKGNGE
jgi:hypothetical protein